MFLSNDLFWMNVSLANVRKNSRESLYTCYPASLSVNTLYSYSLIVETRRLMLMQYWIYRHYLNFLKLELMSFFLDPFLHSHCVYWSSVLKSTSRLFCRVGLKFCLIFWHCAIFGKSHAEVMCSSGWIMSRSTWCWYVSFLVMFDDLIKVISARFLC